MLLSWLLRQVLMYGGLVFAVLALAVLRHRIRNTSSLPRANVVGTKGAARQLLSRWWPALAIIVGIGLFYWSYTHKIEYVIVRDGASGPEVTRRYGASRVSHIPLAPGVELPQRDTFGMDPVWVENLSTRTVQVKTIRYGRSLGFGNEPTIIPPNTSAHFLHIDHVGPFDQPPQQVKDEVNLGMSSREWLTWD
jgi:hypothetical protein